MLNLDSRAIAPPGLSLQLAGWHDSLVKADACTSDSHLSLHANYTYGGHVLQDGPSNKRHLVTHAYKTLKDSTNAQHIKQEMQE